MGRPFTEDQKAAIRCLVDQGIVEPMEHERRLGLGHHGAKQVIQQYLDEKMAADPATEPADQPHPDEHVTFEEAGDDGKLACVTREEVRTEEDLVRVCKIDTTRWRIARMKVKAYQAAIKLETRQLLDSGGRKIIAHRPHTVQLFSISADLERVVPRSFDEAVTSFFEQFRSGVEPLPPAIHVMAGRRAMAEFDLCDVHFGKLAYHRECGQNYDLRIAERVFSNAVDDLIDAARGREIERIVVPFGNDYTHIDNGKNQTNAGTPVDTDGRYDKIINVALWSFYRAIERWRQIAPTKVLLVRGNHDFDTSIGLIQGLALKFDGDTAVEIDVEPAVRKYDLYGKTLFVYEHGNDIKPGDVRDLPGLMMKEAPKAWLAEAEFHEGHIGHYHSEKKFTTKDTDTGIGFVTRFMHSLSAVDAWHFRKKYVGARRAAEVYFYDRDHGYKGHSLALARD